MRELGLTAPPPDPSTPTETLIVPTDASWQVSVDGRTWAPATPFSAFGRHDGIWDGTPGDAHERLFFRTSFVVPGEVRAARAEGGADDDLIAFEINGTHVFGERSGYADLLLRADALGPDLFTTGENKVVALARNVYGHSAFGAELAIDFLPTPMFAAALAAQRNDGGRMVTGANGGEHLYASDRADLMSGAGGADRMYGLAGTDILLGGDGDDALFGGDGVDVLHGGRGDDRLYAAVAPTGRGPGEQDTLFGGAGHDWIYGGAGDDLIDGGAGRDRVLAGHGDDRVEAGDGDDLVSGGGGDDVLNLGDGDDLVFHDATPMNDFGRGDDRIFGEGGDDRLHGGRGDDVVDGGVGNDILNGGPGADLLVGGAGQDTFQFRGAYGVDRIADFAPGDRIAIGQGVNGLGAITADLLIARLSDAAAGAVLDLGSGNAVVFEALAADAVRDLLPAALDLI